MTPEHERRAVGYVRLSRLTDESTSVERQREIVAQAAEARGWTLVETVEDVDVSASKKRLDRPGLRRVRELVAERRVDVVIVWRLDRLARSVADLATLVDEWDRHSVALVSATEPFDATSSAGRMLLQLLGVFAEFEAATIRDRVRSSRGALIRAGRHAGGVIPYGYRAVDNPDGPGRVLVVDPEEAAVVRRAADFVLDGGSLYGALKMVRESGSLPRRAAAWSISSLRVVLVGDAVLGRVTYRGRLIRDEDGFPAEVWDPVLPLADVERLRALLEPRPRTSPRRRRTGRLLSGLVVCHGCGGKMRVNTTRPQADGPKTARYFCAATSDGRVCAAPVSIAGGLLDDYVEREFLSVFARLPVVESREVVREVADLARVEDAIRSTMADLSSADDEAQEAALFSSLRSLKAMRTRLLAQPTTPVVEQVETGQRFAEAWQDADLDGRRALVESALTGPIVVRPGARGRKGLDLSRLSIPWAWETN